MGELINSVAFCLCQYSSKWTTNSCGRVQQWPQHICVSSVNASWRSRSQFNRGRYSHFTWFGLQSTNGSAGWGSVSSYWPVEACYNIPVCVLLLKKFHVLFLPIWVISWFPCLFFNLSLYLTLITTVTKQFCLYFCRLVTKNTVDESIYKIAQQKLVLDAAVLEGKESSSDNNDGDARTMGEILSALLDVPQTWSWCLNYHYL